MVGSFPGKSVGKESACNAGDVGLISGLGRSPGGGHGNLLWYSCLENPMDRGAWWVTVHGVTKSRKRLSTHASMTDIPVLWLRKSQHRKAVYPAQPHTATKGWSGLAPGPLGAWVHARNNHYTLHALFSATLSSTHGCPIAFVKWKIDHTLLLES